MLLVGGCVAEGCEFGGAPVSPDGGLAGVVVAAGVVVCDDAPDGAPTAVPDGVVALPACAGCAAAPETPPLARSRAAAGTV